MTPVLDGGAQGLAERLSVVRGNELEQHSDDRRELQSRRQAERRLLEFFERLLRISPGIDEATYQLFAADLDRVTKRGQ